MRKDELTELLQAIDNINYQLMKLLGDNNTIVLEYGYVTYTEIVKFLDTVIWHHDDDMREWIEESGCAADNNIIYAHYEPIEPYLRKKVNELVTSISSIKL